MGAGYVYHLDVRPTSPNFAISVTPDNPNIGRGGTVLLNVTLQRRVGFTEPILLSVEDLPPGITASQSAILSEGGNKPRVSNPNRCTRCRLRRIVLSK